MSYTGNLNADYSLGLPITDPRGKYIDEWGAELDLVIGNNGSTPPFEYGNRH